MWAVVNISTPDRDGTQSSDVPPIDCKGNNLRIKSSGVTDLDMPGSQRLAELDLSLSVWVVGILSSRKLSVNLLLYTMKPGMN